MNGSELFVEYIVAERQREAAAARMARLASQADEDRANSRAAKADQPALSRLFARVIRRPGTELA